MRDKGVVGIVILIAILALGVSAGVFYLSRAGNQNKIANQNFIQNVIQNLPSQTAKFKGQTKLGLCDPFLPISKPGTRITVSDFQTISDDIADAKSLGIGILRPTGGVFAEDTVEISPGNYDYSVPDLILKKSQEEGIELFGTLYPKSFSQTPTVNDLSAYGLYVKAMVSRYSTNNGSIRFWEVGIEPICGQSDSTCFKTYFNLVKTTYESAKSVNQNVVIFPGGAAPVYDAILKGAENKAVTGVYKYFFDNGGASYMDAFNFHYFVGSSSPDVSAYISYWKKFIGNKEIWLSETGSRDSGDRTRVSSNPDEEASWVKTHIKSAFANGVSKVFWCEAGHSLTDEPKVFAALKSISEEFGGVAEGSPAQHNFSKESGSQMMQQGGGQTQGPQQGNFQPQGGGGQQPGNMPNGGYGQPQGPPPGGGQIPPMYNQQYYPQK